MPELNSFSENFVRLNENEHGYENGGNEKNEDEFALVCALGA